MPHPVSLSESRDACRRMTRHHAKTFYFASHTLPQTKRRDAYAVYAFCRYVDDQIDLAPGDPASALAGLRSLLDAAYRPQGLEESFVLALPWFTAFTETIDRRAIPKNYFEDLLIGVEMDCRSVRIGTWTQLEEYCYHVASVVGLIMVHVLTEPSPTLLAPARHLGTAMQLTNILRDIREDWERDRLYLPARELEKFGLNSDDIDQHRGGEAFRAFMRYQIGRARAYYSLAEPGIKALPRDGSQLTVRLMSAIYGAILEEIEKADCQVFRGRVRVSFGQKVWITLKAILTAY
jgi:phytoene synthase